MLLDFVVISFSGELSALLLQAKSLRHFNTNAIINKYYIVWNDVHDRQEFDRVFYPKIKSILNGCSFNWEVILRAELLDEDVSDKHKNNGERIQQLLKILMVARCCAANVCVFDSKNHAVRSIEQSDFVTSTGILRCHSQSYPAGSAFNGWLRSALDYFGVDESKRDISSLPGLPSTTPYVMSKSIMVDLINTIEFREKQSFAKSFLEHKTLSNTTEFLLYYAFVMYRFADISVIYKVMKRNYVTLFNKSPEGEVNIMRALEELKDINVKFAGFHRKRRLRLSSAEKDSFVDLWCQGGLFSSRELACCYLENEAI